MPGSIDPTGMSGRVSGWLHGAGTSTVRFFAVLWLFVIEMLDPDLYRSDLDVTMTMPGSIDPIGMF